MSSKTDRHAGDAVLGFLSKITLNTWADKQLAEAFWLDRLTAIARDHPNDPRALTWLGIRLREFERTRKRIRSSALPVSVVGLVLRPIVRPVLSAAAGAISSGDGTPASTRVLSRAWELLHARIQSKSATSSDLCLMARLHHAAGDLDSAWLVIDAASKVDQARSETSYIAAEVLYDLVRADWSWQWALRAWNQGCTLAAALLRPDTADRRRKLLTERAAPLTGVTAVSFWQHKAWYFDGADAGQLAHYFGPSPLTITATEGVGA